MNIKTLTFRGGTHPPHGKKATERLQVEKGFVPRLVVIPMQQHIGAPCEPIVKAGDEVRLGQKIGEAAAFVAAPVHSSVSGRVVTVEPRLTQSGNYVNCVVIESDGQDTLYEQIAPLGDLDSLSPEQIKQAVKDAGIVGLGGAAFPTHVKLSPPSDKSIDTVILNGAECEPYLTSDHRLMVEQPEDIVYGLRLIMKALGVKRGFVAIENNKPDAISALQKAVSGIEGIEVAALRTKYPQGGEKQLIYACTRREVPSGGLPSDIGVVVNNVGTAAAVANAIRTGMPLIERIVTVTGDGVKTPKNILARIGTSFGDIIEQCGGLNGKIGKIISGGPMMGIAQYSIEVPAVKGTSGILVLSEKEAKIPEPSNCIRCGKCIEVCPLRLMPGNISTSALKGRFEQAEKLHAMDCMECGSCSFVCPAARPLVESVRLAKREIINRRKKAKV